MKTSNLSSHSSGLNYDPGGMILPGRVWVAGAENYRFGMNGQEQDDEIYGNGNSYTAEFWQYDPRLMRRWNVDPVYKAYESPYCTFGNNPIFYIDPHGDTKSSHTDEDGNVIAVYDDGDNGVYKHKGKGDDALKSVNENYSSTNTTAGGEKMGKTFRWDEFAKHDAATGELKTNANGKYLTWGKIHFGETIEPLVTSLNAGVKKDYEEAREQGLFEQYAFYEELAHDQKNGGQYDIKSWYGLDLSTGKAIPHDGFLFKGYYITVESAGNYLAGLNAASVKPKIGLMTPAQWYMIASKKAGKLHMQHHNLEKSPQPTWYDGEIEYTGRMFWEGYKSVYDIPSPQVLHLK